MNFLSLSSLTSVGTAAVLAVGTTCAYEQYFPPINLRHAHVCEWGNTSATAAATPRIEHESKESNKLTERIIEHIYYIRDILKENLISPATARESTVAWLECWIATGCTLPVPAACTGPDGQLQYVWDRGEHHLEMNFVPSEPVSIFYRNRQTGELWMDDFIAGTMDAAALEKLRLVA
jgi:hypothetical protein